MRINDQDIVRMAQKLRDEGNLQLHVRPWSRHRRFQFPAWLAAIPAAAIIGFLLGIWTNSSEQGDQPMTALVDTVYVTVKEASSSPDTMLTDRPAVRQSAAKQMRQSKDSRRKRDIQLGQPVMSDRIRYDLLVKN